jgi:hypothetical protein
MINSDIITLTNNNYFFIYSQTCLAGSFDNWTPWYGYREEDSAAEHFTVETPHGAFAVIMNSRYGLGSNDTLYSPSQILDESFFKALFTEKIRELGRANHYSKEDHIWHINENGIRWVYYETNLLGDPEVAIKTPDIRINDVKGGFGISATVKNTGDHEWNDIKWSIELNGDAIIFLPPERTKFGTIPRLAPGEETTIKTGLVLGLGKTAITIKTGDTQNNQEGFVLLFLVSLSSE